MNNAKKRNDFMTVSLCVVALNEEKYIINLLNDLLNQDYPHELTEIVLIDSGSIDKTKQIMVAFKNENKDYIGIKVLDNPKRIQAAGWNVAIKNFSCDVLIRIDAHTKIPSDFVSKNMSNLEDGEYVSGGKRPCLIENQTKWGEILLRTENSLFGSSINTSRHSTEKQYVKSMFHAAYKREVLASTGLFNERLLRTEDNEFHYRIRQAGYKLCYDPKIVSYQYARSSFKKMIKQKYGNGYWIGLTLCACPGCVSIYHLVPLAFVVAIVTALTLGITLTWIPTLVLLGLYGFFAILNSIISCIGNKFNPFVLFMPFLFFTLHVSYGVGTMIGLLKAPFFKRRISEL